MTIGGGGGAPVGDGGGHGGGIDSGTLQDIEDRDREQMRAAEHRAESQALESFLAEVGLDVLRGAVVGAACAAMPAACPTILALNEAYKAGRAAQEIHKAYTEAEEGSRGRAALKAGAQVAAARTVTAAVASGGDPILRHAAESFGAAVAGQASVGAGLNPTYAKLLAQQTAYHAMKEGLGGVISWGIKHAAG